MNMKFFSTKITQRTFLSMCIAVAGILLYTVGSLSFPLPVHATELINQQAASDATKLGTESPLDVTAAIISAILGILGIITVGYIIYSGFLWLTAGGSEQRVTKAKGILRSAIIGLILIITSYSIAVFVFSALEDATGYENKSSESGSLLIPTAYAAEFDPGGTLKDISTLPAEGDAQGYTFKIISAFLQMMGVITLVIIMYGGFTILLARGEAGKIQKGKDAIFWAIIGTLLILSSLGIVSFLEGVL